MAWQKLKGGTVLKRGFFLVVFLSSLLLALGIWQIEGKPAPLTGMRHSLNDQIGYITAAKNLIFKGYLETTTILPSTLGQKTRTKILYVPGYFWALAGSFRLFGFNFWGSIFPSVLGYLITVVSVYLISLKLFNLKSAILASIGVMVFPFFLLYSVTAMAEMTVIASATLSFLIAVYLPNRHRWWLGAFLSVLPVFFRETSIIVCLPIAGLIWNDSDKKQKATGVFKFIGLTAILFILLMKGPLGGRPTLLKANIFGGINEIYMDALFSSNFNPPLKKYLLVVGHRFFDNLMYLLKDGSYSAESLTLKFALAMSLLLFYRGIKHRTTLTISVGSMAVVLLFAICSLYAVTGYRGLRVSLVLVPFMIIVTTGWLVQTNTTNIKIYLLLALLAFTGLKKGFLEQIKDFEARHTEEKESITFIDDLNVDKEKVLIAPLELALPWVLENYPVRWSFLPSNKETFKLLNNYQAVGTILLNSFEMVVKSKLLEELGYKVTRELSFHGQKYYLYDFKAAESIKKP